MLLLCESCSTIAKSVGWSLNKATSFIRGLKRSMLHPKEFSESVTSTSSTKMKASEKANIGIISYLDS